MRQSIEQLEIAKQAALEELARDRARCHARIDEFRNLITVLEEAYRDDLKSMASAYAHEKTRIANRFEGLKGHFLAEIDKETRALADLDAGGALAASTLPGEGATDQAAPEAEAKPEEDETEPKDGDGNIANMIGHNVRRRLRQP